MSFIIAVDSNCDLPLEYVTSENLHLFHIIVQKDGKEFNDDLGQSYSYQSFYNDIRNGALPTTSQVNVFSFKEQFLKWAKAGEEVLYLAFSSGLSGTYNSAQMALSEVLEEYPDAKITIIDTLAASSGCGLLIYHACTRRKAGKSLKEVADFIENTKNNLCHLFTVNDLFHLERGGRLSRASAVVGSLLQIKPVLHVDLEGHLIPHSKARGRKKALRALVDEFVNLVEDTDQPIMISHSDCLEDAKHVAHLIEEQLGMKTTMINLIGPGIGSHCGADVIALFFIGKQKVPNA